MFSNILYRSISIGLVYALLTACSGSTEPFPTPLSNAAGDGSSGNSNNGANVVNTTSSGDGVVTLSWLPPTENTDGSNLTDLSGYKIYYGTSSNTLNSTITVNNPGLAEYVVENLNNNTTYYFAITAIKSNSAESNYSNIVNRFISS
ncbi:MAG: fibronectin type III domain-containing protein [Gammaproteobacteria bacterium]|nr:fibronectin type III domain-containing protein [Gammaproteobacteria bacterium]